MNEPHNSTTPSIVTGPKRKHILVVDADPIKAYQQGVQEGRRQAAQAAHPAGLHKPTHGGHCG